MRALSASMISMRFQAIVALRHVQMETSREQLGIWAAVTCCFGIMSDIIWNSEMYLLVDLPCWQHSLSLAIIAQREIFTRIGLPRVCIDRYNGESLLGY